MKYTYQNDLKQLEARFLNLLKTAKLQVLLCDYVISLLSGYQDMVGIYFVKSLKAETQKLCFDKIMLLQQEVQFNVIGVSVDNAAANRKFYKNFLCDGILKQSTKNEFTGEEIFLIFDPTRVIKKVYNNFLIRKVFKLPRMSPLTTFADVTAVFDKMCHKPMHIAHKLSEMVLNRKQLKNLMSSLLLQVCINLQ